jgi:MFS family permease
LSGFGKAHIIFPLALMGATGNGLSGLGMIFYLNDHFRASGGAIGWYAATWSLAYIFSCWFLCPCFRNILPRYLVLASTLTMSTTTIALAFAPNLALIFLLQAIAGAATALFWPPLTGWLSTNCEGTELNRILSYYNFSWSCGIIVSPYLAAWLSEIQIRLPLYCAAGILMAGSFLIIGAILALPGIKDEHQLAYEKLVRPRLPGLETWLRFPAWLSLFSVFTVVGVLVNLLPMYGVIELHLNKTTIGFILLFRAMIMTLSFILFGKLNFWHFRAWPILFSQTAVMVLTILLIFTTAAWPLLVLVGLLSVCTSFTYFTSQFHCTSGSVNRPQRIAIHESTLVTGLFIGSLGGGYLYQYYSTTMMYLFCAGLMLVCLLLQIRLCRRHQ